MKPKKILVWETIQESACAFYRSKGVLEFIQDDRMVFDFYNGRHQLSQHDLYAYDAVFVNRTHDDRGAQLIQWAEELGLGVVTDYDDDLFNVEPDNERAYPAFSNPIHQNFVRNNLMKSHMVTVTVDGLAKSYGRYNNNIQIIPNAFNDHIFDVDKISRGKNKVVLWRGGESHRLEIAEYAPQIVKVMKKFPDWKFVTMGFRAFDIERKLHGQAHHVNAMPLIAYFHYIRNVLSPLVAVVPLRDNVFNASKSNIAWQEATWAGAEVVVPKQYQWQELPAHVYESTEDFADKVESAIVASIEKKSEKFDASVSELRGNWLLSEVNKKREQAYWNLFK